MTLDEILTEVLYAREGWPKVTDHPADLGGLTRGGITFASYNRWKAKKSEPALSRDEFVVLPETEARRFLKDAFAGPFRFVTDEPLFVLLVDWAINAGTDDPAKALQTALKARGFYEGAIDGVAGPKTRQAWYDALAAGMSSERLKRDMVSARVEFHFDRAFDADLRGFIKQSPRAQVVFLRGWIRRTLEFA